MRNVEQPSETSRGDRVTIAEAGEELGRRLEVRGRKKSHRLTVASDLRNHIDPFLAAKPLEQIEPRDIERYIALKLRTLSPKTVRNHLGTMHSVFELGLRMGWCERNPVKLADRPVIKTTETRIKFLDQPELEKLLAVSYPADAFGSIEPTLYLTAAMTGLRQGELIGLRWRDVDLDARRVRVVAP
jgi:integrase